MENARSGFERTVYTAPRGLHLKQGVSPMSLIRVLFLGLAVLLPAAWTTAMAADEAPAEGETKKEKKTKKSKKADKGSEGEKKAE